MSEKEICTNNKNIKNYTPVLMLTSIALGLCGMNFLQLMFSSFYYDSYYYSYFDYKSFLGIFIILAAIILMVVYLLKYYNSGKATVLIPIIIGLLPLSYLFSSYSEISIVFTLIILGASSLGFIASLKGFSNKLFIIISFSAVLICEMIWVILESPYYLFFNAIDLSKISLYVALLLFGLKNNIPILVSDKSDNSSSQTTYSVEQKLKLLNENLELGLITKEEYTKKRAEILSEI